MNIELPALSILTVTTDENSTATIQRLAQTGDQSPYAIESIAESTTAAYGPFPTSRNYVLTNTAGAASYSIAASDSDPSTSANLAGQISDETGTGAAVFATSPTITTPIITLPVQDASADGAITVSPGIVKISKSASAAALTLDAPASSGISLIITSTTNKAHVITATGLIADGTDGYHDAITLDAHKGAGVSLVSIGSKWHVISLQNATVS